MNTSHARPDQRWFLNLTMAIVLAPAFVMFGVLIASTDRAENLFALNTTIFDRCVLYACVFVIPAIALLSILWKGWSRAPIVLLVLAILGLGLQRINYSPTDVRHVDLEVGE